METGPRFIVPSDGLEKPGIELATPGLQGEWHNHCTTEASGTFWGWRVRVRYCKDCFQQTGSSFTGESHRTGRYVLGGAEGRG